MNIENLDQYFIYFFLFFAVYITGYGLFLFMRGKKYLEDVPPVNDPSIKFFESGLSLKKTDSFLKHFLGSSPYLNAVVTQQMLYILSYNYVFVYVFKMQKMTFKIPIERITRTEIRDKDVKITFQEKGEDQHIYLNVHDKKRFKEAVGK